MEQRFEEILGWALSLRATDIHFTIVDNRCTVKFRALDGLKEIESGSEDCKLFNYLQYQARLDISGLNIPQTGSFSYFYGQQFYDFRLAVIRTNRMQNAVLRILNHRQGLSLAELTSNPEVRETFLKWIKMRSGLILFSGLTGSGKTTTMYSLLKMVRSKTIYSLEDPIEVQQDNIIQLELNEKIGFGYDEGIKQILRHNPDIIMIGEIRDETAARMCIRAALTGCLVLSSLHSRSTTSAINRLLELGVNREDLKESLVGISNQRLVKQACRNSYICLYDLLDKQELDGHEFGLAAVSDHMDEIISKALEKHEIELI